MATSTRALLLATWRPLRDAVPREIAPVVVGSRRAPSPSSTTHRSDDGCFHDGAPPSSRDSTIRPRRTTRRTHAPPRNPRTDRIAPPTHRRSSTERLDTRRVRDHASTRRSRSPMRSPRRLGCLDPGLHLLRRSDLHHLDGAIANQLRGHQDSAPRPDRHPSFCAFYVVGVFNDNDEGIGSAQNDFVRSTRKALIDDTGFESRPPRRSIAGPVTPPTAGEQSE